MSTARKEIVTKLCIATVMVAMVALCIANPNEDVGSDCITSGQIVIIEDSMPPLAAAISKTTTKTSVKKSTKTKNLKKAAKKSSTVTKKNTKKSTTNKTSGKSKIKTETTVLTTTKTISKKKSKKQTIQTTVQTTVKTTTTQTTTATGGEVKIRDIASKADPNVIAAFEKGGYKILVNPKVSYSGVFRSATKTIELKTASAVVYHELGHFVSYRTGRADSTSDFKAIYNAEKGNYTASNKAYVTQSTGEYFAESFKNYTENPTKLKSERPQTYAYVKDRVDQF